MNREPRDERGPDDERDGRDVRRPDDPRDTRDPRLPGDPFDAATAAGAAAAERAADTETGIPRFVKWIGAIIVMGLSSLLFTAWQVSALREDYERRLCEQVVRQQDKDRAAWLFLLTQQEPEQLDDPGVVEFVEFLDNEFPPLMCVSNIPTPIPQPEE